MRVSSLVYEIGRRKNSEFFYKIIFETFASRVKPLKITFNLIDRYDLRGKFIDVKMLMTADNLCPSFNTSYLKSRRAACFCVFLIDTDTKIPSIS